MPLHFHVVKLHGGSDGFYNYLDKAFCSLLPLVVVFHFLLSVLVF